LPYKIEFMSLLGFNSFFHRDLLSDIECFRLKWFCSLFTL
jgi:hypothetical protein